MLVDLVRVLRRGDMGDISPIMDEIFDSEHAIKQVRESLREGKAVQS